MDLILLLIGLLLILGTGFFVAVEFSLVALEAATVQQAKDSGDKAADAVLRCLKTLSTQLLQLPDRHHYHHPADRLHPRRRHQGAHHRTPSAAWACQAD